MREPLITPAGLLRLSGELDRLKTAGRREIALRLRHALATEADPSANADYQFAREEQAMLEARIARLEERLGAARVVEPDNADDVVDLGECVRLRNVDTGARHRYELVGSLESDPRSGRISAESPLGRALLGRRKGEIAAVEAPKGRLHFKILRIEAAATSA